MNRERWFSFLPIFALLLTVVSATAGQPPGSAPDGATGQGAAGPGGQGGSGQGERFPRRPGGMGPARDSRAPVEEGTGRIRGRVTDDAGQPLRRASVTTMSQAQRGPKVAMTDEDGRYELTALPPASYYVTAVKGAYVRQAYGQRSPNSPGRPIELAQGQTVDKIDFTLPRGGVIVGRVVDEFGEPMAETHVMALRYMTMGETRRLQPVSRNAETDDLGQFRLYGLPPGEYYVSATSRPQMTFGPGGTASSGENSGYAPTFAPGTTNVAEAARVQVAAGQDVTADIQLTASHMLRVSGAVMSSSGKPASGGFVRLVPRGDMTIGFMGPGLSGPVTDSGAFAINQVPPGTYTLSVRTGEGSGFGPRRRGGGGDADDDEFATMPITVAGEDLVNLRVVTGRGITVAGVVVAEGGPLPTDQPVRVMFAAAEPQPMMGGRPTEVQADGRFELDGITGEGRVQVVNLPRGWMVKSTTYKNADVAEKAQEFSSDGGPVRIVLTNRLTVVTGTVTGGNGAPLTDYDLIIFSEDASRWPSGRGVRVVRPDQQGVFKVQALKPGDYHIAAFEALGEENRNNPEFLEKVRSLAQSVTVEEGQTRSLSLKLASPPQ